MNRSQPQSPAPSPAQFADRTQAPAQSATQPTTQPPAPSVTRPRPVAPGRAALLAAADAEAEAAARASRVAVRELTDPAEHLAAQTLFAEVWEADPGQPPMPASVMRMLAYTGSYVAGAFDADRLVGGGVAFLTGPPPESGPAGLHSHIVGVSADLAGRHAGLALKLHQRAWALRHGIDRITWTYDPLVRRNAYFNLAKLGAYATRYLVDFYGDMSDGLNAGQGSDRLLVDWELGSPRGAAAIAGIVSDVDIEAMLRAGRVLLPTDDGGSPEPTAASASDRAPLLCGLPADIERMRTTDPARALEWRLAVRDVLGGAMAEGYRIAGFARAGYYLLEHAEEADGK